MNNREDGSNNFAASGHNLNNDNDDDIQSKQAFDRLTQFQFKDVRMKRHPELQPFVPCDRDPRRNPKDTMTKQTTTTNLSNNSNNNHNNNSNKPKKFISMSRLDQLAQPKKVFTRTSPSMATASTTNSAKTTLQRRPPQHGVNNNSNNNNNRQATSSSLTSSNTASTTTSSSLASNKNYQQTTSSRSNSRTIAKQLPKSQQSPASTTATTTIDTRRDSNTPVGTNKSQPRNDQEVRRSINGKQNQPKLNDVLVPQQVTQSPIDVQPLSLVQQPVVDNLIDHPLHSTMILGSNNDGNATLWHELNGEASANNVGSTIDHTSTFRSCVESHNGQSLDRYNCNSAGDSPNLNRDKTQGKLLDYNEHNDHHFRDGNRDLRPTGNGSINSESAKVIESIGSISLADEEKRLQTERELLEAAKKSEEERVSRQRVVDDILSKIKQG